MEAVLRNEAKLPTEFDLLRVFEHPFEFDGPSPLPNSTTKCIPNQYIGCILSGANGKYIVLDLAQCRNDTNVTNPPSTNLSRRLPFEVDFLFPVQRNPLPHIAR